VIQTTERLADIAQPDWDALVGADGFYLSYDWLSYVESEQVELPRYLLDVDAGTVRGALTLYRVLNAPNIKYRAEHFRELLGVAGDTLLAGACRGYRSRLLLPPGPSRTETLAALLEAARAQAGAEGCAGIVLPFMSTRDLLEVARLAPVRAAFEMPEAEIGDCGQGLDAYTGRMRAKVRERIRSDRARFDRAGWSVRERNLDDCWRDAARLLDSLERKHGHTHRTIAQLEHQVAGQAKHLADRSVAFTCEDDNGIAGLVVCYRWRSALYARLAGFDYDVVRGGREYFNTVIYGPIEYAATAEVDYLHLGPGSWEAKGYRGARLRPLWSAFIPTKGKAPGLELANSGEVHKWIADITHRSIDIDPSEWNGPVAFPAAGHRPSAGK
jgi:predicted N-acyltransferase